MVSEGSAAVRPVGIALAARNVGIWLGLIGAVIVSMGMTVGVVRHFGFGVDSHAYWYAWHRPGGLYGPAPEQRDAYLYSPVFAEIIWPLTLLPWPLFAALWLLVDAVLYCWLLQPLPRARRAFWLLLLTPVIVLGNVWSGYAAVVVLGFARSEAWSFALLTKVAAAVGLPYFALRGEWRQLARALVATAAVVAVSFAIAPDLWHSWFSFLLGHDDYGTRGRGVPFFFRLPVAAALVVIAARRDRPQLLPWALALASPVLGLGNFAVLAALPRLDRRQPQA